MATPRLEPPVEWPSVEAPHANLVRKLYRAGVDPSGSTDLVDQLSAAFGGSAVALLRTPCTDDEAIVWSDFATQLRPRLERWFARAASSPDFPRARVFDLGETVPEVRYGDTSLYRDLFRPLGLAPVWPLVLVATAGPGRPSVGMVVHRRIRAAPFTRGEIGLARSLAPHVVRSLDIHSRLRESGRARGALAEVVDRLLPGVVFLDGAGRVVGRNRSAARLLRQERGLRLAGDVLAADRASECERLRRLVRGITASPPLADEVRSDVMTITPPDDRPPLSLYFVRLLDGPIPAEASAPVACAFIGDPSCGESQRFSGSIRQLFGLTRAETELVDLLARGCSLHEIAAHRHTTVNTVRTQIRNVFRKTATARQGDLVRLALTSVAVLTEE